MVRQNGLLLYFNGYTVQSQGQVLVNSCIRKSRKKLYNDRPLLATKAINIHWKWLAGNKNYKKFCVIHNNHTHYMIIL